jgi:aspartate-semialdehyde dehydrogenase
MDPQVPLVVPEVNPQAVKSHKGIIANPNCSTIAMVVPLYPLHKAFGVKRVVAATYQAASGAGAQAMQELEDETRAVLDGREYKRTVFPQQYAFNLFPHNSPLMENGYVEEEIKMVRETHKIFGDASIRVTATCVRVPVLRAHSEALNIEFGRDVTPEDAYRVLREAPGVEVFEDRANNRWATPLDVSGRDPVLVGRIRRDLSQDNTLDLWLVSDQLLKGAALNAVQIAELL